MSLETTLIILGLAVVLLLAFVIPLLIQVWRSAKSLAVTIETLNMSLPTILKNLEEITTNVNKASQTINNQVDALSGTLNKYQGIVGIIGGLKPLINILPLPLRGRLSLLGALWKGIKAFCAVLTSPSPPKDKRRGGNDPEC